MFIFFYKENLHGYETEFEIIKHKNFIEKRNYFYHLFHLFIYKKVYNDVDFILTSLLSVIHELINCYTTHFLYNTILKSISYLSYFFLFFFFSIQHTYINEKVFLNDNIHTIYKF